MFRRSLSSSRLAVRSDIFRNSQERLQRKTRLDATRGPLERSPTACATARAANATLGATRVQVFVRDNDVEQALRILKRKMQREGVFREMRRRRFYEKPSDRATREKAEAVRRARKLARKQAIRDGLIAAPVRKPAANGKNWTGSRANSATERVPIIVAHSLYA